MNIGQLLHINLHLRSHEHISNSERVPRIFFKLQMTNLKIVFGCSYHCLLPSPKIPPKNVLKIIYQFFKCMSQQNCSNYIFRKISYLNFLWEVGLIFGLPPTPQYNFSPYFLHSMKTYHQDSIVWHTLPNPSLKKQFPIKPLCFNKI